MGNEGLSVKKRKGYQGLGKTWKQGLEPTERQKAIELKLEKESGCVLLKFLGEERRNRGISRNGVSLKKTRAGGEDWESSPPSALEDQPTTKPRFNPSRPLLTDLQAPAVSDSNTRQDKTLSYTRTQGRDSKRRTR